MQTPGQVLDFHVPDSSFQLRLPQLTAPLPFRVIHPGPDFHLALSPPHPVCQLVPWAPTFPNIQDPTTTPVSDPHLPLPIRALCFDFCFPEPPRRSSQRAGSLSRLSCSSPSSAHNFATAPISLRSPWRCAVPLGICPSAPGLLRPLHQLFLLMEGSSRRHLHALLRIFSRLLKHHLLNKPS